MAATFQRHTTQFLNALDRKLEPPVKNHLKQVYSTLSMCTLVAGAGSYLHVNTHFFQWGLWATFGALGLAISLALTPDNGKNREKRLMMLTGFAGLTGLSMGPLVEMAIFINPTIITMALFSTGLIFASFSLSAIFSSRGKWLCLGAGLMSMLSMMFFMSIANMFLGSYFLYQAQLYLGLLVFCLFIMYDTADIIEKRRMGDDDYIQHSMHLFINIIDIFRTLVVILMQKERNDRNNRNRR